MWCSACCIPMDCLSLWYVIYNRNVIIFHVSRKLETYLTHLIDTVVIIDLNGLTIIQQQQTLCLNAVLGDSLYHISFCLLTKAFLVNIYKAQDFLQQRRAYIAPFIFFWILYALWIFCQVIFFQDKAQSSYIEVSLLFWLALDQLP